MALDAKGQKYCKVVHMENGRTWTRRVQTIMVQAANGKLHYISGDRLPDSFSLYRANLTRVRTRPKCCSTRGVLMVFHFLLSHFGSFKSGMPFSWVWACLFWC